MASYKLKKRPKYDMDDEKKSNDKKANIKWLPSSSRYCNQSSHEKILYGEQLGDRRQLIEEPFNDKRAIIRCIGQLRMTFSGGNYKGTGTVFAVKDGTAYIITCAHNAVEQNEDDEIQLSGSSKGF
mgnify:CR=1 FL=1